MAVFEPNVAHAATNAGSPETASVAKKSVATSVKKRRKVSRACDSCRKKKIKCSGTLPCISCQNYGCECVYSSTPGSVSKTPPAKPKRINDTVKVELQNHQAPPILNADAGISFGDTSFTCVGDFLAASSERQPQSCDERLAGQEKKTNPVLYTSNKDLNKRISDLRLCVSNLQRFSGPQSESIVYAVKNIEVEIEALEKKLAKPSFDHHAIDRVLSSDDDKSVCLEAKLLRNHYSRDVKLNRYVTINTDILESYLDKPPMIDTRSGLHYSGQWSSLRRAGFFVRRYIKSSNCNLKNLKEDLYLLLRHFDIAATIDSKNAEIWASPLESYCVTAGISISKDEGMIHLLKQIPADLLQALSISKNEFKLGTWEQLIAEGQEKYQSNVIELFHWVVALLDTNRIEFQKQCRDLGFSISAIRKDNSGVKCIHKFIKREELLFSLGLQLFKEVKVTGADSEQLSLVDDILDFIKNIYWIDGHQTFSYMFSVAVQLLRMYGVDSWETYLVMNERAADRRRSVWWKAFFWDQFSIFVSGSKPIFRGADTYGPLFPYFISKFNYIDYQDLIERFDKENVLETVNFLKVPGITVIDVVCLVIFLLCFFSRQFQGNVTYNDRFLNFRVYSLGEAERVKMAEEILSELKLFKDRLEVLKEGLRRAFEENEDVSSDLGDFLLADGCCFFSVSLEAFYTFAVISVTYIVARLDLPSSATQCNQELKERRKDLAQSWRTVLAALNSSGDVFNFLFMSKMTQLVCISYVGENLLYFSYATLDDVCSLVETCVFFDSCGMNYDGDMDSRVQRSLLQVQNVFKLVSRVVIQLYMQSHGVTFDGLLELVVSPDHPEYRETVVKLFDTSFSYFSPSFKPMQETELHFHIKNWLSDTLSNSENDSYSIGILDDLPTRYVPSESKTPAHTKGARSGSGCFNPLLRGGDKKGQSEPAKYSSNASQIDVANKQCSLADGVPNGLEDSALLNPILTSEAPVPYGGQGKADQGTYFNLGTIFDFVDHGDMDQLLSLVWDDLGGPPVSSTQGNN